MILLPGKRTLVHTCPARLAQVDLFYRVSNRDPGSAGQVTPIVRDDVGELHEDAPMDVPAGGSLSTGTTLFRHHRLYLRADRPGLRYEREVRP